MSSKRRKRRNRKNFKNIAVAAPPGRNADSPIPIKQKQKVDVAIFVALEEEFDTFRSRPPFSNAEFVRGTTGMYQLYDFRFIDHEGSSRSGVFVVIEDMAERVKDAFYYLEKNYIPDFIISAGISAAVDDSLLPGDVVLSTQVSTPFSKGKIVTQDIETKGVDILFAGEAAPTAEPTARKIRSEWKGHEGTQAAKDQFGRSFADLRRAIDGLPSERKRNVHGK